ncbi:MAG: hypothetical protein EOO51_09520 [Flavobacterium sp.]|nr:MAG: hypothetical protein EOO51_09520 [Flavobacterium sp.]
MKVIETRTHGYLDYMTGILLIILPFLAGWDVNASQSIVPMVLGAMTIIMSLMTAYELGVTHIIPMPTHLTIDLVSGLVLAASPWLFGFADQVYLPHLIVGIFEIMASLMTKTRPQAAYST